MTPEITTQIAILRSCLLLAVDQAKVECSLLVCQSGCADVKIRQLTDESAISQQLAISYRQKSGKGKGTLAILPTFMPQCV